MKTATMNPPAKATGTTPQQAAKPAETPAPAAPNGQPDTAEGPRSNGGVGELPKSIGLPSAAKQAQSLGAIVGTGAAAAVAATAAQEPQSALNPAANPRANWVYVLDTTATMGEREHHLKINGTEQKFVFKPREPLLMPPEVAVKFLKHDSWKRTDADGTILPWQQTPKQPHDLGAGERFEIQDDQTIAMVNELHTAALKVRCMQVEGGEIFAESKDRERMVAFLIKHAQERKLKNRGREERLDMGGLEEWTPPVEPDSSFHDWA